MTPFETRMFMDGLWEEVFIRLQIRKALRILAMNDSDMNVNAVWSFMDGFKRTSAKRCYPPLWWSIGQMRFILEGGRWRG